MKNWRPYTPAEYAAMSAARSRSITDNRTGFETASKRRLDAELSALHTTNDADSDRAELVAKVIELRKRRQGDYAKPEHRCVGLLEAGRRCRRRRAPGFQTCTSHRDQEDNIA